MRLSALMVLTGMSLLGAAPAWADQCAWIEKDAATAAFDLIKRGMTVIPFCEPCDDERPGPPMEVLTTEIRQEDKHLFSLVINGQEVDLAYLYIQMNDGTFANVAQLVGCPAEGVTASFPPEWYQEAARNGITHKIGRVNAANPAWQETGLHYEPGDALVVRAQGEVQVGGLWGSHVGPDARGAGALEIKVGDGDPMPVGRQFVFAGKTVGSVLLRVKDTQYTDNQGSYEVQILQIPAPLLPPAEDF